MFVLQICTSPMVYNFRDQVVGMRFGAENRNIERRAVIKKLRKKYNAIWCYERFAENLQNMLLRFKCTFH